MSNDRGGTFRQRAAQYSGNKQQDMPSAPSPDVIEAMEDSLKGGWVTSEQHKFRFLTRGEEDERPVEQEIQLSDLSSDQRIVFDDLVRWFNSVGLEDEGEGEIRTLGGYAGTGKSTIVSVFAKHLRGRVAYCALTGKAASVLKQKLKRQGAWFSYVGTIHGLIYRPTKDYNDNNTGFKKVEFLDYDLIVVDEASMLSEDIVKDIRSFGIPVLAVGDHGQLPPIEGRFNLMENPHLRLERVHRLAEGNPIIQLSMFIRENGYLPAELNNEFISYVRPKDMRERLSELYAGVKTGYDLSNIAILCYSNSKRRMANNLARELRWSVGEDEPPRMGDLVICLRNAVSLNLFNGMRARVLDVKDAGKFWYYNHVVFDEENLEVKAMMFKPQFNRNGTVGRYDEVQQYGFYNQGWMKQIGLLFDFGYALTVHKAQGSQFRDVFLLYERPNEVSADDFRKWLYTATTRSSNRLTIVTK